MTRTNNNRQSLDNRNRVHNVVVALPIVFDFKLVVEQLVQVLLLDVRLPQQLLEQALEGQRRGRFSVYKT